MTTNEKIAAIADVTSGLPFGLYFSETLAAFYAPEHDGEPVRKSLMLDDIAYAAIRDYWRTLIENKRLRVYMQEDDPHWIASIEEYGDTTMEVKDERKTIALGLLLCKVLGVEPPKGIV